MYSYCIVIASLIDLLWSTTLCMIHFELRTSRSARFAFGGRKVIRALQNFATLNDEVSSESQEKE